MNFPVLASPLQDRARSATADDTLGWDNDWQIWITTTASNQMMISTKAETCPNAKTNNPRPKTRTLLAMTLTM